ncbi:hypothetical protein CYMTET_33651 [Cymbomonas tetramitiformis]|uniref:Uncharacterized protein n=1 Tax=Cymbomonas tetramitiformis TaxID=36881 RepID=A0AAE0KQR3_9CHLO|nr:hypothetical protein CYMTET_33651 [Cymbomonas tetramitiformis]
MAPKVKTGGSRSASGALPDQFQDAETKVDAGATESQLLAAVQQLSQETCALAVYMEAVETEQVEARISQLKEEDITEASFRLLHTVQDIARNLRDRHTMPQLYVEREANPGRCAATSTAHLELVEDPPTQAGTVTSDVFNRWFREVEDLKSMHNLKHAAGRGLRGFSAKESLKWKDRDRADRGDGKGSGGKGAGP